MAGARRRLGGRSAGSSALRIARARRGGADSDLDVALVVTTAGRARRRVVYDLAYDLGLQHGVLLSPLVIERGRLQHLRDRERLFAAELDRDGIPL